MQQPSAVKSGDETGQRALPVDLRADQTYQVYNAIDVAQRDSNAGNLQVSGYIGATQTLASTSRGVRAAGRRHTRRHRVGQPESEPPTPGPTSQAGLP